MNMYWRRRFLWLAIFLLITSALVYGFRPQPRLVDVAEATHARMQVSVEEEGKTRVIDRYIISAPVPGTTCRTGLNVGDQMDKDQALMSIDPLRSQALDPRRMAEAQSRVAAANAALKAAEQTAQSAAAEAQLAQKELSRLKPLAEQGHISQDKLDHIETLVRSTSATQRSSRFAVDVMRHELEAARTAFQYTGTKAGLDPSSTVIVRAPVSGKVLKIHQECEGVVSAGQPLMEIGDTRSLEIETDVLSSDAVKIKPGMKVTFSRWGGESLLEGKVRTVEPVGFTKVSALGVEEQRVLVISDFTSDMEQWQSLGDGYRVEAHFILWEADNILQIPASALFRYNEGWAVFVMDDEKAKRRIVEVGQRNGLSAQIVAGLEPGEKIITHPDDSIDDNVLVKLR